MLYIKKSYLKGIALFSAFIVLLLTVNFQNRIINTFDNKVYSKNTVVIDAGHGGKDAGTIGVDGTLEKDINLGISLKLYDFLMISGIDTKLIRSTDTEYYPKGSELGKSDLYNRLDFVNSIEKSVLVSIHQNHYVTPEAKGAQIWYSTNNAKSKIIADNILSSINRNLQPDNTRVNKESGSDYYILYRGTVPSVMVECGFMSNPEENSNLKDIEYQKKLAFSVLEGICEEV
ncbi:MAG: N-acetylmuramoyl-L-alanine amidase [Eubacterium sp.]|nr:N-acetylmuramoyl-L-alanine amidase [Eubacterium sp.]